MAFLIKILDKKIALQIPPEIGASNLNQELVYTSVSPQDQSFTIPVSVQDADPTTGYLQAIEALKTAVDTFMQSQLDDTSNFIIDVIIQSVTLTNTNISGSIFQTGTLEFLFETRINYLQTTSLDPSDVAQSQSQILLFGVQADATPPTIAPTNKKLGLYGTLDITSLLTGTPQNAVVCVPVGEPVLRIIKEGAADNISDWVRNPASFVVGSTTYDAYVKQTAIDNTFTNLPLFLVP